MSLLSDYSESSEIRTPLFDKKKYLNNQRLTDNIGSTGCHPMD